MRGSGSQNEGTGHFRLIHGTKPGYDTHFRAGIHVSQHNLAGIPSMITCKREMRRLQSSPKKHLLHRSTQQNVK